MAKPGQSEEGEEEIAEPELDVRGLPAGVERVKEPIVGKVSKDYPLFVRMLTLGRGVQDFVVEEVTARGTVITPPWTDDEQIYRIGERGRSYDVFIHRELGTRHALIYEGLSTPPTHLVEGRWVDADPASDAAFLKNLGSYEAAADLLTVEEPLPPYFWVLTALAVIPWGYLILRLFVAGI